MTKKLALLLAGLFALVTCLVVIGRLESDSQGEPSAPGAELAAPMVSQPAAPGAELASIDDGPAENAEQSIAAPRAGARSVAEVPDDAVWVRGTVIFPEHTPKTERVTVVAHGLRLDGKPLAVRDPKTWPTPATRERIAAACQHRSETDSNGNFEVAFAKGTTHASIDIEAGFLFLPEKLEFDLPDHEGEIELRPKVGGVVKGQVNLGSEFRQGADHLSKVGIFIYRTSGHELWRWVPVRLDGSFEFGGVATGSGLRVGVASSSYYAPQPKPIKLAPLEVAVVNFGLKPGVLISGRVVDGMNRGQAGAELTLVTLPKRYVFQNKVVISKADGSFFLEGARPGEFELIARARGLAEKTVELGKLADGEVLDNLVVSLESGVRVEGRVVWPDGSPAVGAAVTLRQAAPGKAFADGDREIHVEAGADGAFSVAGLTPGTVRVVASARMSEQDGSSESLLLWSNILVQSPGEEMPLLTLAASAVLEGRVIDDHGAPYTTFKLTVWRYLDSNASKIGKSETFTRDVESETGSFRFPDLQPGRWFFYVHIPGGRGMSQREFYLPSDEPVELVLPRTFAIQGVVRSATGQPVAGAKVSARPVTRQPSSQGSSTAVSDAAGRFELKGMIEARYTLSAKAKGWAPSAKTALDLTHDNAPVNLQLFLLNPGLITGEVLGDPSEVGGRQVKINTSRSGLMALMGTTRGYLRQKTITDSVGQFRFEDLPSGLFTISMDDEGGKIRPVDLRLDAGATHHVVLSPLDADSGLRIFGWVRAAGQPLVGAEITSRKLYESFRTKTDDDGAFEFILPGPGEYHFRVGVPGTGSLQKSTQSFRRKIKEPGEQSFEYSVGAIEGTIFRPGGKLASGLALELVGTDELSGQVRRSVQTDARGHYRFELLSAGTYFITWPGRGLDHINRGKYAAFEHGGLELQRDELLPGINIQLELPGTLAGIVYGMDGKPQARVRISIMLGDRGLYSGLHLGVTNQQGRFRLRGVPSGSHTFRARISRISASQVLSIRTGETTQVEFRLKPR